jgi:hypothetical protein
MLVMALDGTLEHIHNNFIKLRVSPGKVPKKLKKTLKKT